MDNLEAMTLAELTALFAEKKAAFDAIKAKTNRTLADVTQAEALAADLATIAGHQAKFGSLDSLEESFAPKPVEPEVQAEEAQPEVTDKAVADPEDNTVVGGSGSVEREETVSEQVQRVDPGNVAGDEQGGVPLQAAEQAAGSALEQLAARGASAPAEQATGAKWRQRGGSRIVATPDLEKIGVASGTTMDMLKTGEAVLARLEGIPAWNEETAQALNDSGVSMQLGKLPTAQFAFDIPPELMIVPERMSDEQIGDIIDRAVDESSLPGGSLVAAGGWCAPSEQTYDLSMDASTDGMLSLPEVGIRRGGLKWPISPDFSAFYANPGFTQTETQAIAGATKTCVTVDCPSFDEKRMAVEGLCIKIPILTNVGYPEYVKNFIDGTLVAHQHWMNANFIAELLTIAGSAKLLTGFTFGSTTSDLLAAIDVMGERIRQKYKLAFNTTVEVVLPHWVLTALRQDISNRSEQTVPSGVADNVLMGLFRERKANVQFVYDWQELALTDVSGTTGVNEAVAYPATFDLLMYPAGTVFKGTQPVINLSTVYDAASLAVNTYTGLFTEQGYLIGKRKFHIERLTIPVCNAGRAGAHNFTCS